MRFLSRFYSNAAAGIAAVSLVTSCAPVTKLGKVKPVCASTEPSAALVELNNVYHNRLDHEVALAHSLKAAQIAGEALRKNPRDTSARTTYNFAVGRAVEHLQAIGVRPRTVGDYKLTIKVRATADRNPDDYEIIPSDTLKPGGTSFKERVTVDGLGAPLTVATRKEDDRRLKKFMGKRFYGVATAVLRFNGNNAELEFVEPLAQEHVTLYGHSYPVAADFTSPLCLGMTRERPDKLGIVRLLNPERYSDTARLTRLQTYDPNRIPIVFVHGLVSTPATWVAMINSLRADPEIRRRYQFWVYSYPSGYPYPYSASLLRQELNAVHATFPNHKPLVLVGHSMGGCISRLLITDAGDTLWRGLFKKSPAETHLMGVSDKNRKILEGAVVFNRQPHVARVVFLCAPLRGAETASTWIGRLGAKLVRAPHFLADMRNAVASFVTVDSAAMKLDRLPNSIDTLAPNNNFVLSINQIPVASNIPYHVIVGDRGRGGAPNCSDGLVAYSSSHMDGAASECIVPYPHTATESPKTIEEVKRILRLHIGSRR